MLLEEAGQVMKIGDGKRHQSFLPATCDGMAENFPGKSNT
jgi:hypothetical protein